MNYPTRSFPPPYPTSRPRGGTAETHLLLGVAANRSPRTGRTPPTPITRKRAPRAEPLRLPSLHLLPKRGGTGGTVLENGGKRGTGAYPPGSTVRGNGGVRRCMETVWVSAACRLGRCRTSRAGGRGCLHLEHPTL